MQVRPPAVAGSFYPGQVQALQEQVRAFLQAAQASSNAALAAAKTGSDPNWPKALIVPHAGYIYSGATAAQAFALLAAGRGQIRRVVLLGPVHRVAVRGLALPGVDAFGTPLGLVPVDQESAQALMRLPQVLTSPAAHAREHSLEVQLPLLQSVLGTFSLVPLAVGDASAEEVAQVLELLWGGPETVIVISSDLSHYLPYEAACEADRQTVLAILSSRADLNHRQACGATPVNGMTLAAKRHGFKPRLLAQCNSGDTAGDRQRVVGYASLAYEPAKTGLSVAQAIQGASAKGGSAGSDAVLPGQADTAHHLGISVDQALPADAGRLLLPIGRCALGRALGRAPQPAAPEDAPWLHVSGASFVTLTLHGRLRGCVGSLVAHRTLLEDVKANAVAAALRDPRFQPLDQAEFEVVGMEVSVLSVPQAMPVLDEADALAKLRPGIDGVIFMLGSKRSTFLPQVWAQLPTPVDFLAQLKRKAGLAPDFWSGEVRLQRYTVRKWTEAQLRQPHASSVGVGP